MSISRRQFLVGAGVAALGVSVFSLTGCNSKANEGIQVIYGSIFTGTNSTLAEALVVKDGKVEYCGTADGAKKYEGNGANVTKFETGQLIIPGLIDAHCHPAYAWYNVLNAVSFGASDTLADYKTKLTQYIKDNPDKSSIRAKGWWDSQFEGGIPTAAILDEICSDKPILATDAGGHGFWCNTKTMELFFAEHPELKFVDPEKAGHDVTSINGGTIERDSEGKAVGCFRDTAGVWIQRVLPLATKDDHIPCIQKGLDEYISIGYTSYVDAYINETSALDQYPRAEAYMELEKEGKLPLYVDGAFIVGNNDNSLGLVDQAIALHEQTKDGRFRVTDVKIFMDGVVEGGSAWLLEEYADQAGYYGTASWKTEEDLAKLTKIVAKANEAGMAVHFHAIGDRASTEALNCIAKAAESIGAEKVRAARNVITHLQIVDDASYAKFIEYGVVANLNPWGEKGPGVYEETEVVKLGRQRAEKEYPVKTFLDKGIHCSFGTDYGSSFIYAFGECYHVFTTRTDKSLDPATTLNPSECLTPAAALQLMSAGGAYQTKREDVLGTLEVGKIANLVVLDQNLFEIDAAASLQAKALGTMVDGVWLN